MSSDEVRQELQRKRAEQVEQARWAQVLWQAQAETIDILMPVLLDEVAALPLYEFERQKSVLAAGRLRPRRFVRDHGDSGWCIAVQPNLYLSLMGTLYYAAGMFPVTYRHDRGVKRGRGFIVGSPLADVDTRLAREDGSPLDPPVIASLVERAQFSHDRTLEDLI
ncbi:hypothetical protein [Nocardia sp. NPDC020380]|uniref:hypothetical protein n=1 Tax=Nocardia sp. NPDC020380 TaxID=3364309 RepID=UPI00379F3DDE